MKKELIDDNRKLREENKKLQKRIDNAIEYINNSSCFDGSYMTKHDLLMLLSGIIVRSDEE